LASLHDVPFVSLFVWHTPDPLHVSGLSQAVSEELPQAVPLDALLPLVHAPDWHESLTVQALPSLHAVPFDTVVNVQVLPPKFGMSADTVRQVGPLVSVPLFVPTESATIVPVPSFIAHRCIRPAAEVTCLFMLSLICWAVRALFQIRSSSSRPSRKRLGAAPGAVRAAPNSTESRVVLRIESLIGFVLQADAGVLSERTPSR
jgi:hypothetical protein